VSNDFRYQDEYWKISDAKEIIYNKIKSNKKVLDLGCWTGRLGEKLINEKKCNVVGVDINKEALAIAAKRLNNTFSSDLNNPEELLSNINQKFDYIIFADVLEHLKSPKDILKAIQILLKPNGEIIISLPNIAYWTIRLKFLLGIFHYDKTGIMDETHLRFFTRKSAKELINSCGLKIENFYYTGRQFFPSLNAFQFVFFCRI
jgi:methionine biosynthesis protein MetW